MELYFGMTHKLRVATLIRLDSIEAMMLPGNFGDSYALQVAANLLGRDIIIVQ